MEMSDMLERMNDEDVQSMIEAIARCAGPWSADILANGSSAVATLADELMRRRAGRATGEGLGTETKLA